MNSLIERFRTEVFDSYLDLLKAQFRFNSKFSHAKQIWEEQLTMEKLVRGPYLEKAQMYELGKSLDELPLHEETKTTIQKRLCGHSLYKHQTDALELLLGGQNAIIATGTSSGKTFCYQVPILDDLIRDPSPGLRAIIIYPLNALVNDQLGEWEQMLTDHPYITFARFTGQTPTSQKQYENRLREAIKEQLTDEELPQRQLQNEVERELEKELKGEPSNRLNHREAIRANPPHILITNFSMLEYLMERPVDAPIFKDSRLKFLVLDEAHSYRGVQATEIAFLVQRLKDRLNLESLISIATSATLGKPDDQESKSKVCRFARELFGEDFSQSNPIYGTAAQAQINSPRIKPTIDQYIEAAEHLHKGDEVSVLRILSPDHHVADTLADLLKHDENLYRLRKEILSKPVLLSAAASELWGNDSQAQDGLQALLEIVAVAKKDNVNDDLLPTRLHYFVRVQDGLHVCLNRKCPGRSDKGKPAFFVSRKNDDCTPEGLCPACHEKGKESKLVEVVTCRKCGYLFGALQDMGPRRAQNPETAIGSPKPYSDSFSTELGWAADSFWSYFCVEEDLPFPVRKVDDEDDENPDNLFRNPAKLNWCIKCCKKHDEGKGDNCTCQDPNLREIEVFHRQCDRDNLYNQEKKNLTSCPNCSARNGSGLEPLRRFQESEDETGLSMAIPLSHFRVSTNKKEKDTPRKLLCFTDHRQRAAAFPSLLEEETFSHDLGRMIVGIMKGREDPVDIVTLGEELAERADQESEEYKPGFFLPASRFPDEELDSKRKRNLWIAEVFSYFGIQDSARESAEDLGLVAVEYKLTDSQKNGFYELLSRYSLSFEESVAALQVLLGFMRRRKAFTLPKDRVEQDATAFGSVTADIYYDLNRDKRKTTHGWLPRRNKDHGYRDNVITDYLNRLLNRSREETYEIGKEVWKFLTSNDLLINFQKKGWKLDHESLLVVKAHERYKCPKCEIITTYSAYQCCPSKECTGKIQFEPFDPSRENIIARWVAGENVKFQTLKSEEHTAQISKDLAKKIEDEFRNEGVNLLSSTTTFEMGINIGGLQKVLLRNAPPTSANYVQRVGRAGRGEDKNAVCVTLCRRTKYDGDAWNDPAGRLMSGEVRTPTVFTENRIIAQRHFNAVIFSRFLRVKIAEEKVIENSKQRIELENFLSRDSLANLPSDWRNRDSHLDFLQWLVTQEKETMFQTGATSSLLKAVCDFDEGKKKASEKYKEILESLESELSALMKERTKLFKEGSNFVGDIDYAVRNLLSSDIISTLAKRGFLPRYAFPLDTVTLETGWSRWSRDTSVELSRDRGIAIAEFAPRAQVVAHKKIFTSDGLYIVGKTDRPNRLWYAKCRGCKQIRIEKSTKDQLKGFCPVCQGRITEQHIKAFVEPTAFSIRKTRKSTGAERHRRTSLIRQRQTVTQFIDSVEESKFKKEDLFSIALKENGTLFRYNLGPENKGFILCPDCGHSEPARSYKSGKKHKKLRPGNKYCEKRPWPRPLAYGHRFESFCLIVRLDKGVSSVESFSFALKKGLCQFLDIETFDIGVSWRFRSDSESVEEKKPEIILYDRTPGGAGFVKDGFNQWPQVTKKAYQICNSCSCKEACYDCLKDYDNQSHHEKLNRREVNDYFSINL